MATPQVVASHRCCRSWQPLVVMAQQVKVATSVATLRLPPDGSGSTDDGDGAASGGAMPSGGDGAASGGDPFAGWRHWGWQLALNDGNNPTSLVAIPSTVARYQLMPKTAS